MPRLCQIVRDGKVLGQKVGRHWWFHNDAVDSWLNNQPAER